MRKACGFPVVKDVNDYYLNGEKVTRTDAMAAILADAKPTDVVISLICKLDLSSPSNPHQTSRGLVYRVSRINGR